MLCCAALQKLACLDTQEGEEMVLQANTLINYTFEGVLMPLYNVLAEMCTCRLQHMYLGVLKFWTDWKKYYAFCDLSMREKDRRGKPGL
jgi:hypothetical protein